MCWSQSHRYYAIEAAFLFIESQWTYLTDTDVKYDHV